MEADSSGVMLEETQRAEADSVSLPLDSDTTINSVCDSSAGASQLSAEMEEGELPSEDCSKPSTPIKIYNPSLIDEGSSLASSQHVETGSASLVRKPVLGKEKAKQRLKALRIQNKIQLESRNNLTSKKQPTKHNSEGGGGGSNLKKDRKFMYPHEKAQLTINEIEVMKLEGDRPKAPIFYHESMIHRITVDSFDSTINSQLTLTPSIEALKAYNDDEFCGGEERKRKRAKPVAYRRRRRSAASPSHSKRKLKFKRDRSSTRESSRDRHKSGHRIAKNESRRSKERPAACNSMADDKGDHWRSSVIVRPGGFVPAMWSHGEHMRFTQTRPIISFSINVSSRARKPKVKSKSRKKSKRKRETNFSPTAVNQEGEDVHLPNEKPKRKRRSKSKSRDHISSATAKKKKKKKSKKSTYPKGRMGVLSFTVDDLSFEEELDGFPLSKEGFQPAADPDELVEGKQRDQAANLAETLNVAAASTPTRIAAIGTHVPDVNDFLSCAPNINESTTDDKSPDTDDYMPNWEEEDEDSEKDDMFANFLTKEPAGETNNDDAYSSAEETTPESIKDGLGTPIFVNPSPPREILELLAFPDLHDSQKRVSGQLAQRYTKELKESDEEESLTPPPVKPKHLFEMENIYEEFLRSVREDPDFKDKLPSKLSPKESHLSVGSADEESGFLSQSSISLTPLSTPVLSSSPPNSSSSEQSSKTDDTSDTESSETPSQSTTDIGCENLNVKNSKRNAVSVADASNEHEAMADSDELSNISSEDLKKLRSLQKRHGMLKWIRQQIDGMDEEDRLCLLGLEKLIRAERQLLLRNNAIKRLHDLKNILGTDSEDSRDGTTDKTDHNVNGDETAPPQLETGGNSALFDGKREAIKLTITSLSPMKKLPVAQTVQGQDANKTPSDEDQDFTERLMKPKEKPTSNQTSVESQSPPRASKKRQSGRRGRSLSVSPMRRSRKSPSRERTSDRSKRRAYSPSPSRTSSRRRDGKTSSRSRNSGSPPSSTRSRRFCRSPYHPSSSSPTRSHSSSRSPSRSPLPGKEDMLGDERIVDSYPAWNIDRYSQYYVGDSYYFPNTSSTSANGAEHKLGGAQTRYPVSYHDYAQYNMYAGEYMNMGANYQGEFGQQTDYSSHHRVASTGNDDCNPYLSIPVIGSGSSAVGSSANYFYKDSGFENPHTPQIAMTSNVQCMEIHRQEESNSPKPFAVQKGNVLEIVPATTITSVVRETTTIKEESLSIVIKQEPIDDGQSLENVAEDQSGKTTECVVDIKMEVKTSKKNNHSWKDEVARRHVVSAVMRLNKETDDSPRGILKSRGNSTAPVRDKKKVLFADGIPPGRTSSASSDEEATLKFIKKRLKKTHRRMQSENKENEVSVEPTDLANALLEAKADPELWDAPPPPPPPGSPPPHLPQPSLIRAASPEELLYFHYDPVYNMMYVSPMENAIPPRLLQNNGKSVKANVEVSSAENGEVTSEIISAGTKAVSSPLAQQDNSNSPNGKEESTDSIGTIQLANEKRIVPSPEQNELPTSSSPSQQPPVEPKCASPSPAPPAPAALLQQSSPPQQIQNISIRVSSNSPQLYNSSSMPNSVPPSAYESPQPPSHSPSQQLHQSPPTRAPIPIMVGYPGQIFTRMQTRRLSPNVLRSPYSMPPPPHSRAFNPHVPPPFHQPPPSANLNGPHQVTFDGTRTPLPPSPVTHPPSPYNPNMIMFAGAQQQQQSQPSPHSPSLHSLRPQGYAFGVPSPQTPPPHMMMNRPPNRFSSIPPPVPLPQFMHERKGSPRLGSHVFRHHHPPILQPPPSQLQQQPSTPPPGTPYS